MSKKLTAVCCQCLTPVTEDYIPALDMLIYICQNTHCIRFGLLSTTYRIKERI